MIILATVATDIPFWAINSLLFGVLVLYWIGIGFFVGGDSAVWQRRPLKQLLFIFMCIGVTLANGLVTLFFLSGVFRPLLAIWAPFDREAWGALRLVGWSPTLGAALGMLVSAQALSAAREQHSPATFSHPAFANRRRGSGSEGTVLLTVPAGALTGCVVAMFSVLVAELSDELGLNGLLVLLVSGPFLVCSACIVQARLIVKWLLT